MPRACSKLVMLLLMLSVASPALAAGKKKKPAPADKAETSEEAAPAEGDKSTDELMGEATKAKPKAKAGAAGDAEAAPAAEGAAAEGDVAAQEAPAEPDSWERPPEEAEKPKKEVAAQVEEKKGDGRPWMAGLIVGYGIKTDSNTGSLGADPYGLTAGLQGGYTLDFNLYVGVFFQYYLGSSQSGSQARVNTGTSETTASAMQFGAEAGYDFWISDVILRPSLQLGASFAFTDRSGVTRSMGDFIAGPGLGLIVPIDGWYIGGEVRAVLPFANAPAMALLGVQIGLRFLE